MHAESRICLGKLRMSTCEGPAEDRGRHPPPFFPTPPPETARVGWRCTRVRRGCTYPWNGARCLLCTDIRHGVLLKLRNNLVFSNCASSFRTVFVLEIFLTGRRNTREKYSREIINCNSYQQIVWFNKINRIWMSQRMQMQLINHPVYILFFAENFNEKLRILNVP